MIQVSSPNHNITHPVSRVWLNGFVTMSYERGTQTFYVVYNDQGREVFTFVEDKPTPVSKVPFWARLKASLKKSFAPQPGKQLQPVDAFYPRSDAH